MSPVALFLGAGFSVCWGLPVTKDLLPPVKDAWEKIIKGFPARHRKVAERVREHWIEHHVRCSDSVDEFARMLQTDELVRRSLTLDDLAQFLAIRLAVEQSTEREFRRSRQFTRHHIRRQRKIDPSYSAVTEGLSGSQLTGIVTTNYDLVIEKILGPRPCGRLGGFNYGDPEQPVIGSHQLSTQDWYKVTTITGAVPLLKLHGSLNWAYSDTQPVDVYVDCKPSLRQLRPLVVPPRANSFDNHFLEQVRQRASEVLKAAEVWVFCGYSLPPYDADVSSLLRSSGTNLRRVVIFDPNAVAVKRGIQACLAHIPHLEVICGPGLGSTLTRGTFRSKVFGTISS